MNYKYYLDGVLLLDEPKGWDGLVTSIKREEEIKGIFTTQDVKLTFYGDGYDILKPKFDASFCDTTDIKIYEQRDVEYVLIFEGLIFVSACTELPNQCIIEATLEDNSFFAKIKNNKSIDTYCQVGTSKNLVSYTGAITDTFMIFDVCTAVTDLTPRACITVFEAFRSLIAFMSDDTIDFESTLFEIGGEWNSNDKRLVITSGLKIGSLDPTLNGIPPPYIPKFSFNKLFKEIDKNINIGMMIDISGDRPKVVIEKNEFFYNKENLLTFDKINGLKISVDQEKLYSAIHFGSSTLLDGSSCPDPVFPERQSFLSFNDEQYYVLGKCNIDKELNLVRDWIVSSNVIQSVAPPLTDTSHDTDLFLIVCHDIGFGNIGKQGNPFNFLTATPRYWNEDLLNSKVAERYLAAVPNSIAEQLEDVTDACHVARVGLNYPGAGSAIIANTGSLKIHNPNEYNDKTTPPLFDTNNRFALNPTNTYTCGPTSGGLYTVSISQIFQISRYSADLYFNVTANQYHRLKCNIILQRFNSATTYMGDITCYAYGQYAGQSGNSAYIYGYQPLNPAPLIGDHFLSFDSQPFVLVPGDYIRVSVNFILENVGIGVTGYMDVNLLDGQFRTMFTSKGGGDLQTYNPADYPVFKYEFTYPITPAEFDVIKYAPNKSIDVSINEENHIKCFIDQAKYSHRTGLCDFTLIRATST